MNKLTAFISAAPFVFAIDGKCRALVLSGGANKGAWEAGIMWGLLHYGDPIDFTWDVNTGISTGALNTGLASVWETGTELAMTEKVSDVWASIQENSDIYVPTGPFVNSLFNQPSLENNDAGMQFFADNILPYKTMKRRWTNAAVDVETGEFVTMDQTNCSFEDIPLCSIASASVPVVFPPQHWGGHTLMDGGTAWGVNIDSAIQQCLEIVEDPSDIIIDIAICDYHAPVEGTISNNAYRNFQTDQAIGNYWKKMGTVSQQMQALEGVEYRYFFEMQNITCPQGTSLDMANSTTWCLQERGRQDAKIMLDLGQDKVASTLEEWFDQKALQEEYPYFGDYLFTFIKALL